MTLSINSGPNITTGNTNPTQNSEPEAGPSLSFQGGGLLDPRFVSAIGAAPGNKIYGIYSAPYVCMVDAIPAASLSTRIAAAQNPTAATPLTLSTTHGAGVSPGTPVLPQGSATIQNLLAIDFGFCPCSVTSGSAVMTIPGGGAWKFFQKGERIIVPGAGVGGGPLVTTVAVQPAANATTITMSDPAKTTRAATAVGNAHYTGDYAWPYAVAGAVALGDPTQMLSRGVTVTGVAASIAQNVTVRGYDVYGQAMSEVIAFPGGAVTASGKKTFKYIASVTPASTDTSTLSVGTSDIIGCSLRTDFWEYMNVFVNGAFITASAGWLVADANTATGTTGDVRGTYQLQIASNWDGTVANWAASRRIALFTSIPLYNCIGSSNLNYATLFGNTQA